MAHEDPQLDPSLPTGTGVTLAGRLAVWSDARLPLPAMLRAIGEEYGGRSGRAIESLADEIDTGCTLKEAFEKTSHRFPRGLRRQLQMVAGTGGDLAAVLPALASLVASERGLRARLLAILSYPVLVLATLSAVILFLSWSVVPEFSDIYDDFGLELPLLTEFFFDFSRLTPYAITAAALLFTAMAILGATPGLARYVHCLLSALPLFGPLWTYEGHASLARMLATYTGVRMPAAESLRCAASGLMDRNLATAAIHAAKQCENGSSLADAMANSKHFERELVGQVRDGEQNNALPEVLDDAAATYTAHARRQLEFIGHTLPPLMVLVVGGFLMLFVIAMFLPMLKLIEGLS